MKNRLNNKLPNNLNQLQNCIKRDPSGYKDEFNQQHDHFKSILEIFQYDPSVNNKDFSDLVMFLAHVCSCYTEELKTFPNDLIKLLKLYSTNLNPEIRMTLVKALILLRNKSLLTPTDLISLFFGLLKCQDKLLRTYIKEHIITDIKNINSKHKNHKINTVLQNFIFSLLKDPNTTSAKTALDIMIELYKKNIWNDSKTVNMIATACFSESPKIMATALKFFISKDNDEDEEEDGESSDSDDNMPSAQEVAMSNRVNKKTRKRKRLLQRTKQIIKKNSKKQKVESFNFSAIHLLNDPQTLVENLFKTLEVFKERFELKLILINFISRLIGLHQLFLLNFYPFIQRYLYPRQQEVTKLLQYLAQGLHELVPPDSIEPILKAIANNFVTERNSSEVMAVGINSIREMCTRCPLAMNEDLLQDLTEYSSYKDRNVSMAAKSLIQLYRVVNPGLLKRKDRGRPTEATKELKVHKYGESKAIDYLSGAEVLKKEESSETFAINSDSDLDENSNSSWVDVSHSEEEIVDQDEEDTEKNDELLDPKDKATIISSSRILSQEEFQKVKLAQISKQLRAAKPKRFKIGANESESDLLFDIEKSEIVPLNAIERLYKRRKASKQERMESVMSGRDDRPKFGSRKKKKNEFSSKNKKELKKNKSFMMIKHKLNQKRKKSFKEKQMALKKALLKRCK